MKLILRVHTHTNDEMLMGHKVGFTPIDSLNRYGYIISATANDRGFTSLNAIARAYKWDTRKINSYVFDCNFNNRITIPGTFLPKLLLVPQTHGSSKAKYAAEHYITEILMYTNYFVTKKLHFTHYGFIQSKFPSYEIKNILKILLNPLTHITLDEIYWEIDSRHLNEMIEAYKYIANNMYRLHLPNPTIVHAPQFTLVPTGKPIGNYQAFEYRSPQG